MYLLIASYLIFGMVIGSFLNVCIYRLPLGMSLISPPSRCSTCNTRLGFLDLIPVFSYIATGGKCRHCGVKYGLRYPLIELLTGVLFVISGFFKLPGISLVLLWICISLLIIITFIDIDHQIIMDRIQVLLLIFSSLYVYFTTVKYLDHLIGCALAGGIMLIIYLVSKGGMGAGDVKLSFTLGLWLGLKGAIVCLMLAFILGGIIGVLLLAFKIKSRKDTIPFGPYLCLGAFVSLIFEPYIIYWYWSLFI